MKKPLIGITADLDNQSLSSTQSTFKLRKNYCDSIIKHGGIPLIIPHFYELISNYIEILDGLIVSGGNFDVDPVYFGEKKSSIHVSTKPERTEFEFKITNEALKMNKPILGICGGQQLLHVVLGGSLIQHIPDTFPDALEHEQQNPRDQPGHSINIKNKTLLSKIVGSDRIPVNSAHHQSVKNNCKDIIVNAWAPDGVIEGIESPKYKFCLGVQWHPEYLISEADSKIFLALIDASRNE